MTPDQGENLLAQNIAKAMVREEALWKPEEITPGEASAHSALPTKGDYWKEANILSTNDDERAIANNVITLLGQENIKISKRTIFRPDFKRPATLPEAMDEVEEDDRIVQDFKAGDADAIIARAKSKPVSGSTYDLLEIAVPSSHLDKIRQQLTGRGPSLGSKPKDPAGE